MDFFDAVLELEEYISNTTRSAGEVTSGAKVVTPSSSGGNAPSIHISVRSFFRRKYRQVQRKEFVTSRTFSRRGYYRKKYDEQRQYYILVREHLLRGGDPNFIYGVNTPEILLPYEKKNHGSPLLFTCIKDLPIFRLLLFCGVDINVPDKIGCTLKSRFLVKDVRDFVKEHRIFERKEMHFVLYHLLPEDRGIFTTEANEETREETVVYEGGVYHGSLSDDFSISEK